MISIIEMLRKIIVTPRWIPLLMKWCPTLQNTDGERGTCSVWLGRYSCPTFIARSGRYLLTSSSVPYLDESFWIRLCTYRFLAKSSPDITQTTSPPADLTLNRFGSLEDVINQLFGYDSVERDIIGSPYLLFINKSNARHQQ